MNKCGIYIIKNKINNKVYVGKSVNIQARWYAHKYSSESEKAQDHYTKIHQAMKLLGKDNFYYEILELCSYLELSDREKYWISYYDSYKNGYNMTLGGEDNIGESNGRHILTKEQVEEIRLAYGEKIPFRDVYENYKGVISKRGLQKVWHFETWKYIYPEVYTDENRKWHATNAKANINGNKEFGLNNKQRACSEEEIIKMRQLREKGFSYKKIAEELHRSNGVVRKYCLYQESKNPNKIANSVQIKNIETGLIFDSLTQAAKWAHTDRHTIAKNKNSTKTAGKVPTTNEPAHWISL